MPVPQVSDHSLSGYNNYIGLTPTWTAATAATTTTAATATGAVTADSSAADAEVLAAAPAPASAAAAAAVAADSHQRADMLSWAGPIGGSGESGEEPEAEEDQLVTDQELGLVRGAGEGGSQWLGLVGWLSRNTLDPWVSLHVYHVGFSTHEFRSFPSSNIFPLVLTPTHPRDVISHGVSCSAHRILNGARRGRRGETLVPRKV